MRSLVAEAPWLLVLRLGEIVSNSPDLRPHGLCNRNTHLPCAVDCIIATSLKKAFLGGFGRITARSLWSIKSLSRQIPNDLTLKRVFQSPRAHCAPYQGPGLGDPF